MYRGIIILCILVCNQLHGQIDTMSEKALLYKQKIAAPGTTDFSIDNLGNIYLINKAGLLKKLNNKGDSLNVFNDVRRYGTLSALDVTNPLKIILYYRDFSTVVMLDRFLNRVNVIDLRKAGIFQAKAVGLSYDNNLWVYDEQAARLKKIGEDGKLLIETVDLRQVLSKVPSPERLIDRDGFVYLYDPANGMYIFDYYGALKNELPFVGLRDVTIIGNTVLGRKKDGITRYTLGTFDLQEAAMPGFVNKAPKVSITALGVYLFDGQNLLLYAYQ